MGDYIEIEYASEKDLVLILGEYQEDMLLQASVYDIKAENSFVKVPFHRGMTAYIRESESLCPIVNRTPAK